MKSPFPGMDPFIEGCGLWEDFHSHLIERIGLSLADTVPERYVVRTRERSYVALVKANGKVRRAFLLDVSIVARRGRKTPAKAGAVAVSEAGSKVEPVLMRAYVEEEHRERFIEIFELGPSQRLVTSIEVLSPSNKRPGTPGWDLYQRKRQSLLLSGVNLVEIDLVRSGERMPMLDPWPNSPYTLLVTRPNQDRVCTVWAADFRRSLPSLPVPLAKPDPDVSVSLQPMIDSIYQTFHYEHSIDYRKRLTPPLSAEDKAWLKRQLRARKH